MARDKQRKDRKLRPGSCAPMVHASLHHGSPEEAKATMAIMVAANVIVKKAIAKKDHRHNTRQQASVDSTK